ncbi:hypothetical protein ECIV_ORF107 [European chub iridovirus]|nr:hypothetical protein ECIV_ORF107 [European chub iridovirus]
MSYVINVHRIIDVPHKIISPALGNAEKTKAILMKYLQRVTSNKHCREIRHSLVCEILHFNDVFLDRCELTDNALRIPVNYAVKVCTPTEQDTAHINCCFDSGLFATNCCKNVFVVDNKNNRYKKTECCSKIYAKGDNVRFKPYYWKIGFRQSDSKYIFLILCKHVCE